MTQLEMLVARGAQVNAGHLDLYDGKHRRLGSVTTAGDLVLTAEGEAYVANLAELEAEDAAADAAAAEAAPRGKAKAKA